MVGNQKSRQDGQGFTIIEVLIVLAIAGLIMVVVFLAVPALQRNSRNNSRKADARYLALQRFQYNLDNNTSASVPPGGYRCDKPETQDSSYLFCGYVRSGIAYYEPKNIIFHSNTNIRPLSAPSIIDKTYQDVSINDKPTEVILVDSYLKCAANGHDAEVSDNVRNMVVLYVVESGSSGQQICIDNGLAPKS